MSNEADRAEESTELFVRVAISNMDRRTIVPCGQCHYCSENVRPDSLFCSPDCAQDWEQEQRIKKIAGR